MSRHTYFRFQAFNLTQILEGTFRNLKVVQFLFGTLVSGAKGFSDRMANQMMTL